MAELDIGDDPDSIGIIGGTGPAGIALATRLAAAGRPVVIGSRQLDRAAATLASIVSRTGHTRLRIAAGTNADAARCADVVLAVTADHTVSIAAQHSAELTGRIVVSMASRLRRVPRGFSPDQIGGSTVAEAVQAALPGSRVVAALQHLPADQLADIDRAIDADILVCGDDSDAVSRVMEVVALLTTGRVVDAGPLANAAALEALTAVLVTVNVRERAAYSIQLVDQSHTAGR